MTQPDPATAIVTGAGSARGIGRATALALAGQGFHVAVLDIDEAAAVATSELLRATYGVQSVAVPVDVTDQASVTRAVTHVEQSLPPVAVLANIAGISAPTRVENIDLDEWNKIFAVNMTGTFLMTQAVLPGMRARQYGRIINMSSVSGQRGGGIFGASHYSASKAAVLGFTKALAREVGADGITVNAVAPSMVDTDIAGGLMTPERKVELGAGTLVGRLATPDDVASAVAYLALPASDYLTGMTLDVNGGSHLH